MQINNIVLFLGFVVCCHSVTPNIDELFKSLTGNEFDDTIAPPDVIIRNISIDLEKLNLSSFTEKLKKTIHTGNITGDINTNLTRRLMYQGSWSEWNSVRELLIKMKLFDMMLQTIYMARHKIKQIENEPYYNPQDTSYRIAFLYRRIRRIWKRMMDIYTTMSNNRASDKHVFQKVNPFLILHHKAAKLHVDFLYLWWVLVKMHEKYDYRHGIPNTTPH